MNGTNKNGQKINAGTQSTAQKNKSRSRYKRICGTLLLIAALTGTTSWVLSKSATGKDISGSSITISSSAADESSSSAADTNSAEQTKAAETTTAAGSTGEQTRKHTQTSVKAAAKTASTETAAPKIEVKDGVTYVNGILIANKTYSLPESYDPGLSVETQAAFSKMQQAAAADGIQLWICSGYRNYSYQQQLYNNYADQDGKAAADRYSARAGHSEHQTGLAIDVNEPSSEFDNTPEAEWLAQHCSDYGFIIRYKPGKESSTGYMAESWHIRYLGDVELCKKIEASGQSLEEFLGITSAYADN